MNCKPGDLAIVVRSLAGNEGKIVRCIGLLGMEEWDQGNHTVKDWTWEIDRTLASWDGTLSNEIRDGLLRPIRDNPGADESLTWAPRKEKEPA